MTKNIIKLAKKKGFISKNILIAVDSDYFYLWMCELQKWLREVHEIHVEVRTYSISPPQKYSYYPSVLNGSYTTWKELEGTLDFEEAQKEGLQYALKLIK